MILWEFVNRISRFILNANSLTIWENAFKLSAKIRHIQFCDVETTVYIPKEKTSNKIYWYKEIWQKISMQPIENK